MAIQSNAQARDTAKRFSKHWKVALLTILVGLTAQPSQAISPRDLASSSSGKLTANPASIGGMSNGVVQNSFSLCRPLTSLTTQSGTESGTRRDYAVGGSRCYPITGEDFSSNQGALGYHYVDTDPVFAAFSSLYNGSTYAAMETNYQTAGIADILYENRDYSADSLELGYGFKNFGIALSWRSEAEWFSKGEFVNSSGIGGITYTSGESVGDNFGEWSEESVMGIGVGTYLTTSLGSLQIGYRVNTHTYAHDYYLDGNPDNAEGIQGSAEATSYDVGFLMPNFFQYFSISYSYRMFPNAESAPPKMKFEGSDHIDSIEFTPREYGGLGLGLNFRIQNVNLGFNLESAGSASDDDYGSSTQAYRVDFPSVGLYYGTRSTSYSLVQIQENTAEIGYGFIRVGLKEYVLLARSGTSDAFSEVGKIQYPTLSLDVYFGPNGIQSRPYSRTCNNSDPTTCVGYVKD